MSMQGNSRCLSSPHPTGDDMEAMLMKVPEVAARLGLSRAKV
jgi:hypothetical protein